MRATARVAMAGALAIVPLAASGIAAQSLSARVTATDGVARVVFPSRPTVCGDGTNSIGHLFGGSSMMGRRAGDEWTCLPGPVRVTATVIDGQITRLRTAVGPLAAARQGERTITATAADAAQWLGQLIDSATPSVASDAMVPLLAAEGADPWPVLLRAARNGERPRSVRQSAMLWLSNGATERLGLARPAGGSDRESDEDQMREQAVFVVSQRPAAESVPELLDIVRTSRHAAARRAALFWLGQTGDARAVELYAELLGLQ